MRKPPGSIVHGDTQTIKPDSFTVVDMAERAENAVVRDVEIALDLLGGKNSTGIEHLLISPRGVMHIAEEQFFPESHGSSINGS